MTERAANAVDAVLPPVPVRQWVLSLPHWLRNVLAWDHGLCRAVLAAYVRALLAFQRLRARRLGVRDGQSGILTVIQRFGCAQLGARRAQLGRDAAARSPRRATRAPAGS
jgi:hypothetical protein